MVATAVLVNTAPSATTTSASVPAASSTTAQLNACPTVTHRIPAGWYPDRENLERRRWWSGTEWTDHYAMPDPVASGSVAVDSVVTAAERAEESRPVTAPSPRHSAATGPQPVALVEQTTRAHIPLIVTVLIAGLTGADAVLLCMLALAN